MNATHDIDAHQGDPLDPGRAIEWFDSWFDVRLEHGECLQLLRDQGALSLSAPDPYQALAYYVGSSWCEMIQHDVGYAIRRGALIRERSRIAAELLDKWTTQQMAAPRAADSPDIHFAANVLARWMDGAGKLFYRNKQYTDARMMFERALGWAHKERHWFLLPDLKSNHVRADFEEQRTAHKAPDLVATYQELLDSTRAEASSRKVPMPTACADTTPFRCRPDEGVSREKREFLRGLCSILHNMSLAEESQGQLDSSEKHSRESELIAQVMDDQYRLAQAVNHQALLHAGKARKEAVAERQRKYVARARELFARVRDELRWRRGRLIAWQQSARLLAETSSDLSVVLYGVDELKRLLDEIKTDRQFASGEQSADLEIYDYTVGALRGILDKWTTVPSDEARRGYEKLAKLVEDEELTVARAVRSVVKISQYKQNYNRARCHVFEYHIAKHIDSNDYLRALAILEEVSGRELLDVLAVDVMPGGVSEQRSYDWEAPVDVFVLPEETRSGGAEVIRAADSPRRFDLRRPGIDVVTNRKTYLEQALQEYEYEALQNPIPVTSHDPEVAQKVVELSKRVPGFAMVRYASLSHRDRPNKGLCAFVVRGGQLTHHELDWRRTETALQETVKSQPDNPDTVRIVPDREQARSLWDALLAPLWHAVAPSPDELPEHLVLVPHVDLFQAPLHLALENNEALPLAARVPLAFSVSATMHLAARRYARRWLPTRNDDDLCAIVSLASPDVTGQEICRTEWDSSRLHVFGDEPADLWGHQYESEAEWRHIETKLSEIAPEFLVIACHGSYDPSEAARDLGPTLHFGPHIPFASQFDIARRLRLRNNRFTALAACVSGQGAGMAGGDVAGFVRSFIAGGAGALGVTLFSVLDAEIVRTVRHLLRTTRWATQKGALDLTATLQRYYAGRCRHLGDANQRLDACPLVIYL